MTHCAIYHEVTVSYMCAFGSLPELRSDLMRMYVPPILRIGATEYQLEYEPDLLITSFSQSSTRQRNTHTGPAKVMLCAKLKLMAGTGNQDSTAGCIYIYVCI